MIGDSLALTPAVCAIPNIFYAIIGIIFAYRLGRLALESIHIEQEMINEHVGLQDQVAAAFGGFNNITFNGNHNIDVVPITISERKLQNFQSHLMLFFTGFQRNASEIEDKKIKQVLEEYQ